MKVRQGFVSNSSSSSFCLYGCQLDGYEITKDMLTDKAINLLTEKGVEYDEAYEDSYEVLDMLGGGQVCSEEDYIVVGNPPDDIAYDETRQQFETRVQERVKKYFKDTNAFGWICEEYSC